MRDKILNPLNPLNPMFSVFLALVVCLFFENMSLVQKVLANEQKSPQKTINALIQVLEDRTATETDCELAIEALGKMGKDAKPAVPVLMSLLYDDRSRVGVKWSAASVLGNIGEAAVPQLLNALESEKFFVVRYYAMAALEKTLFETPLSPKIIKMIGATLLQHSVQDKEFTSRFKAEHLLKKINSTPTLALPDIYIDAIQDKDVQVRRVAVSSLVSLAKNPETTIPSLRQALRDEDPVVRNLAAFGLGKFGTKAESALPDLKIRALYDNNPIVTTNSVFALGEVGVNSKEIVPALIQALNSSDSLVRTNAANALAKLGVRATPAISKLLEPGVIEDKKTLRNVFTSILEKFLNEKALGGPFTDGLRKNLPSIYHLFKEDHYVKKQILWLIRDLNEVSDSEMRILFTALQDSDLKLKEEAIRSLKYIQTKNKKFQTAAVSQLIKIIQQAPYEMGQEALKSLQTMLPCEFDGSIELQLLDLVENVEYAELLNSGEHFSLKIKHKRVASPFLLLLPFNPKNPKDLEELEKILSFPHLPVLSFRANANVLPRKRSLNSLSRYQAILWIEKLSKIGLKLLACTTTDAREFQLELVKPLVNSSKITDSKEKPDQTPVIGVTGQTAPLQPSQAQGAK